MGRSTRLKIGNQDSVLSLVSNKLCLFLFVFSLVSNTLCLFLFVFSLVNNTLCLFLFVFSLVSNTHCLFLFVFSLVSNTLCLPSASQDSDLTKLNCHVAGFGLLTQDGVAATVLQEVQLPVIPTSKCREYYPKAV